MTQDLVVQGNSTDLAMAIDIDAVVAQTNAVKSVMEKIMVDGTHYMKIPGCPKRSLLQAGAEKLGLAFGLQKIVSAEDITIEKLEGGHIHVMVLCHIMSRSGREIATGVGACSTMESKYRYRGGEKVGTGKPVPTEYWNLQKEKKFAEAAALIGGSEFKTGKVIPEGKEVAEWQICKAGAKAENPDIADVTHTVLAMAIKRAYVAGVKTAVAASDIFTDMEDEDEGGGERKESKKPATKAPIPKQIESVQIKTNIVTMGKATARSKSGSESTVYRLTDRDGGVYTATDEGFVTLCKSAKEAGLEVLITYKTDVAKTVELIDLVEPSGKEAAHGTGQPAA